MSLARQALPQLARGELLDIIKEIAQGSKVALLESVGEVTAVELDGILADYDLGRQRLEEIAKIKLGFWSVLPWTLAALADHSEEQSRGHARRVLDLFDQSPQQRALHHRISWLRGDHRHT